MVNVCCRTCCYWTLAKKGKEKEKEKKKKKKKRKRVNDRLIENNNRWVQHESVYTDMLHARTLEREREREREREKESNEIRLELEHFD